jgi:outer membrane protein assembly factor BamE
MINQLKPGITQRQVMYAMGTPMLVDNFHPNRWDYVYRVQPGDADAEQKRVSLYFDHETLVGIQGDFKPDPKAPRVNKETTVDVPEREFEKTFWEEIVWLFEGMPAKTPKIIPENPDPETPVKNQQDNIFNNRF